MSVIEYVQRSIGWPVVGPNIQQREWREWRALCWLDRVDILFCPYWTPPINKSKVVINTTRFAQQRCVPGRVSGRIPFYSRYVAARGTPLAPRTYGPGLSSEDRV